jgi:predicted DNA-binding transcriptional regulator AlpA
METPESGRLPDELLSAERVRRLFGICEKTLTSWVQSSKLPAPIRVGNRSYWDPRQLREFLERSRSPVEATPSRSA